MHRPITICVQLSRITANHFQRRHTEKCPVQEKDTRVTGHFHALTVIILSVLNHELVKQIIHGVDLQPFVPVGMKELLFIQSCTMHF